ncbi:MAG: hypothetical protein WC069_06545 [Candidatus Shapirobacteria bacterium]
MRLSRIAVLAAAMLALWPFAYLSLAYAPAEPVEQGPILAPPPMEPKNICEIMGVNPVVYTVDDVAQHIRLVNPGAEVKLYFIDDAGIFCRFLDRSPYEAGMLYGMYRPMRPSGPEIIIWGKHTREVGVTLHEYTHLLERMIPDRKKEIRKVFHMLISPDYLIGYGDLKDPIE